MLTTDLWIVYAIIYAFVFGENITDFPINLFFNLNSNMLAINRYSSLYLCDKQFGSYFCCDCHDDCFRSQSCCIDKLWDKYNPIPLDKYMMKFNKANNKYKATSCKPVLPAVAKYGHYNNTIRLITSCLSNATEYDTNGCYNEEYLETYEHIVPVIGSDNYLYQNTFCARCNFVENYKLVNIKAGCEESLIPGYEIEIPPFPPNYTAPETLTTVPPSLVDRFQGCAFEIEPPLGISYRYKCSYYYYRDRSNCKPTSPYYQLCNSYYGIMDTFANYHCYLCEKNTAQLPNAECPAIIGLNIQFAWSFTLQFSSESNLSIQGRHRSAIKETYCNDGKLYNIFTGECNNFTCASGYNLSGTACTKINFVNPNTRIIKNPSFDKCMVQQNNVIILAVKNNFSNTIDNSKLMTILKNQIQDLSVSQLFKNNNTTFYSSNLQVNNVTLLEELLSLSSSSIWNYLENVYLARKNQIITQLHELDFARTFPKNNLCAFPNVYNYVAHNFTPNCGLVTGNVTINHNFISQWISYGRTSIDRKFSICKTFYIEDSCMLSIVKTNYSISDNFTLTTANRSYSVKRYTPLKEGIGICNNLVSFARYKYRWMEAKVICEYYVGLVGTLLSIVSCLIIIATYTYFKELYNLPALYLVGLCFTLTLTDILYLLAVKISNDFTTCKIVAVLLHWSSLANQAWLIVMAFDLLSKFGSGGIKLNSVSIRIIYLRYCLFVLLVPSSIVLIALALNEFKVYHIGYGENNICFIFNLLPKIYFYIIPTALSFLIAITSFLKSLLTVYKQEGKLRRDLRYSGRRKNSLVLITFKLVMILGIVEIIAFIQIPKDDLSEDEAIFNAVSSVLHTFVRSQRGVILFLIYIYNKRTLRLIRTLLPKIKEPQIKTVHSRNTITTSI